MFVRLTRSSLLSRSSFRYYCHNETVNTTQHVLETLSADGCHDVSTMMSNKDVLVFGATGPTGIPFVKAMAKTGANLYIGARNAQKVKAVLEEVLHETKSTSANLGSFFSAMSSLHHLQFLSSDVGVYDDIQHGPLPLPDGYDLIVFNTHHNSGNPAAYSMSGRFPMITATEIMTPMHILYQLMIAKKLRKNCRVVFTASEQFRSSTLELEDLSYHKEGDHTDLYPLHFIPKLHIKSEDELCEDVRRFALLVGLAFSSGLFSEGFEDVGVKGFVAMTGGKNHLHTPELCAANLLWASLHPSLNNKTDIGTRFVVQNKKLIDPFTTWGEVANVTPHQVRCAHALMNWELCKLLPNRPRSKFVRNKIKADVTVKLSE